MTTQEDYVIWNLITLLLVLDAYGNPLNSVTKQLASRNNFSRKPRSFLATIQLLVEFHFSETFWSLDIRNFQFHLKLGDIELSCSDIHVIAWKEEWILVSSCIRSLIIISDSFNLYQFVYSFLVCRLGASGSRSPELSGITFNYHPLSTMFKNSHLEVLLYRAGHVMLFKVVLLC